MTAPITVSQLQQIAAARFGNLVKAVVDVDRQLMAIDAELHADLEALFLEEGSEQQSLWGINLYPELQGEAFIEFDSMINMRPSQGNRSRSVDDAAARKQIAGVVAQWILR
jgi:hypothetical protein